MRCELSFPALFIAARRLGLDAATEAGIAEAALHAMDAGFTEREAVSMSIIETLQRRGAYHGRLKQAVEDGTIFQMREGGDDDGRRARRVDQGNAGTNPTPPAAHVLRDDRDVG